jgi:hypothetical protein
MRPLQQARELLAPVYGWFTEGFDTTAIAINMTKMPDLLKRPQY